MANKHTKIGFIEALGLGIVGFTTLLFTVWVSDDIVEFIADFAWGVAWSIGGPRWFEEIVSMVIVGAILGAIITTIAYGVWILLREEESGEPIEYCQQGQEND